MYYIVGDTMFHLQMPCGILMATIIIDGYSRFITFLKVATNNLSSTVLDNFEFGQ